LNFNNFVPNEPVYDNYGHLGNDQLLLHYGFVIADYNLHDILPFEFTVDTENQKYSKLDILAKCGLKLENFLRAESISPKLLHAMRISTLDNNQLEAFYSQRFLENADNSHVQFDWQPLSDENERNTLEILSTMISQLLGQYPTTIEEDEMILKSDNISIFKRIAVVYRLQQKKILANTLNYIQKLC